MLRVYPNQIKLVVDIARKVLAGGGEWNADCEGALLQDGSSQDNIWGADWWPDDKKVSFESFINIRPRLGNRTMELKDPSKREAIEKIVRDYFVL